MSKTGERIQAACDTLLIKHGLPGLDVPFVRLHPVAIGLTQITIGLRELRLWPEYLSHESGSYTIVARAMRVTVDCGFQSIRVINGTKPQLIEPDSDFEDCVAKLLVSLGCVDDRATEYESAPDTVMVSSYNYKPLSMHARIKMADFIERHIETSCQEVLARRPR
jgi:hypothetical protein